MQKVQSSGNVTRHTLQVGHIWVWKAIFSCKEWTSKEANKNMKDAMKQIESKWKMYVDGSGQNYL